MHLCLHPKQLQQLQWMVAALLQEQLHVPLLLGACCRLWQLLAWM